MCLVYIPTFFWRERGGVDLGKREGGRGNRRREGKGNCGLDAIYDREWMKRKKCKTKLNAIEYVKKLKHSKNVKKCVEISGNIVIHLLNFQNIYNLSSDIFISMKIF